MKLLKMLTSPVKASVIALVLFGALALEAANVSWNGTEGPFDSVEIWPNSKLPVKGDDALLYSLVDMGTKTVTMTNDWTTALYRLRLRPADGSTFVFDGTGHEFIQPDLDPSETVYETTPFKIDADGTYDDFFSIFSSSLTGYKYLGTYRFSDPVIRTFTDGAGGQYAVFAGGTFNFYDPNGTVIGANGASKVRFANAKSPAKTVLRFEGKDTVATFGDFEYMGRTKDNLLEFADGTYSIFGNFMSNGETYDMASGAGAIHRVRVTDGATLNIGGTTQLYLNSKRASSHDDAKYSWFFEVLNEATLNTTNRFYTYRSTNGVMRVENATWNAPGTGVYDSHAIDIGYAADDYAYSTEQKLVLVNATLTCGVKHATGNFHVGRLVSATKRTAGSVYATNSVLTFKGICSYNCGTSILKDCTATYSGNQNYSLVVTGDGDVTLDGGTSKNMGGPRLGSSSYSAVGPILRIKDGDHVSGNESMLGWGSDLAANASVTATIHQTGGKYTATYETFCNEAQPAHFILEGGTLLIMTVRGGAKTHAKVPTKGGWAHFTANGGTVQCNGVAEYPAGTRHAIFYGLDRCEAGPKGLNLFLGWQQPFIKQDITNIEGTRGRFAVSCSDGGAPGILKVTVPSKWDVAETVVEKGVTFLCQPNDTETGASVAFETDMILRPGAKFSTAGGITQVALNTLAATNATIVLDPGDVITVKDALRLRNVTFSFTSDLEEDDPVDFLVYEGERTPEVEAVLKSLPFGQTLADGKCTDVELTTDAAGKTKATVTVRDKPMLGGETTWTGPGSDWNSGDNWSAGVPDGTNTAVFADNAAPAEVTLSTPAAVGALSFLGGAYTISGASLLDFAAFDNSFVSVESGDHEIASPIGLRTAVPLAVESNATLEVSGPVYGGGFRKTGHGAATLSGENLFAGEVTSGGGLLIAGSERAIGGASTLNLGDGTLRIPEGCELIPDDALTLCVNSTNTKGAVVLDNAEDITISSYSAKSGALVKRGKGRLVLDATAGKIGNLTVSKGNGYDDGGFSGSDGNVFAFDEDGTPPTHGFGGFSVAGGEVVIRSTAETPTKVNSTKGAIHVGLYTSTDCGAQPSLTLDHVNLEAFAYYQNLYIGRRGGRKDDFTTNSTVRVLNGSTLHVSAVMLGYPWDNNTTTDNRPTLAVTNSTVNSDGVFGISQLRAGGGAASILTFGSNLTTPDAFSISGSTTSRITGTRMSGKDDAYGKLSVDQYGRGEVLFDGGTVFKVGTVATPAANNYYSASWTKMLTLAFDDATWDFGDKDLTIGATQFYLPLRRFEMRGKGMTLPVPATRTFHTDVTFMGSGDFTKTGAGTVEFGENAYAFTGTSHVEEGVLDLSAAGTVNNAAFAGAGTVRGATFGTGVRIDPGIGAGWSVAAAPTLDSCVFNGIVRIAVDPAVAASLTLPSPPITVAKFTGTKPNLSKLRLAKSWSEGNVGAKFTADESGNILMTADRTGLLMIVR